MSERYTIERGDYGLFFYDQKEKKELTLEDLGDILNGIEELISGFVNDLEQVLQYYTFYPNYKQRLIDLKIKYEAMLK